MIVYWGSIRGAIFYAMEEKEAVAASSSPPETAEQALSNEAGAVPESVSPFLQRLYGTFCSGAVEELHSLYEATFTRLSERHFKNVPWPSAEAVARLLSAGDGGGDIDDEGDEGDEGGSTDLKVFLLLYKELSYRHIHTRLHPTLTQRFESWENYLELFDRALDETLFEYDLPASWTWDILDEFLYHYEVYCQYRARGRDNKTAEEEAYVRESGASVWNARHVLEYLQALVNKSGIGAWLQGDAAWAPADHAPAGGVGAASPAADGFGDDDDDDDDDAADDASLRAADDSTPSAAPLAAQSALYRHLGYYAMVALLRAQVSLGDYRMALAAVEPLELLETDAAAIPPTAPTTASVTATGARDTRLYTQVTACHVSLYYYAGFACLMLHRYEQAIRLLGATVHTISRTRPFHTRSYQYEHVNKRLDQMLAMVGIAHCVSHVYIDESLNAWLRDKYGERLTRMRMGELAIFEELYAHACPKFASPAIAAASKQQFMRDMRQFAADIHAPLRSCLRIYRSIHLRKLAEYLELDGSDEERMENIRAALLALKLKSGAAAASGEGDALATAADLDFLIDEHGLVRTQEWRPSRRHVDYLLRSISRLGEQAALFRRVQRERLAASAVAHVRKMEARRRAELTAQRQREERERERQEREERERQAREAVAVVAARPMSLAERLRSTGGGGGGGGW